MADPLWVPDISHHQAGISIQGIKDSGASALVARVGQGAGRKPDGSGNYGTTRDREWVRHRNEARRVGLPLIAYWYTGDLISAGDNADLAKAWVGDQSIPWMLDHENASGSLDHYRATVAAFQSRGLRVILGYVPRWYWSGTGRKGALVPGPPLVNSAYRGGAGTPATIYKSHRASDWDSYGGNSVIMLQFTNQAQMAGRKIDCSAFRGDRAALLALIEGDDMPLTDADVAKIWGATQGGGFYEGLRNLFVDAATENPAGGYAAQLKGALRATLAGIPVEVAELAQIKATQAEILAAAREDLDSETILARLEESSRLGSAQGAERAISEAVLPAIDRIRALLEDDTAEDAKANAVALLEELGTKLRPAPEQSTA